MKRDDWMLLTLTFLTGLAIGMYVYIVAFKPIYAPENLNNTELEAADWSMIAKRRIEVDTSRTVQPSFRLLGDGSYTYIHGGVGEGALETTQGNLSNSLLRKLRDSDKDVVNYSRQLETSRCSGDAEGYEYEYNITIDKQVYNLDTCRTTLGHNTPLAETLKEVWQEVEGEGEDSGSYESYDSFSDWLEAWLNRNIGVNN